MFQPLFLTFLESTEVIKLFISYGVLGVIGLLFLWEQHRMNKQMSENYQELFKKILNGDEDDVISHLRTITTSIHSHNTKANQCFDDIKEKIVELLDERDFLIEMVTTYNSLIKELKTCVVKIKNNNSSSKKEKALIDLLIKEKLVTKKQIDECLKKISNSDLDELDLTADKVAEILKKKKD